MINLILALTLTSVLSFANNSELFWNDQAIHMFLKGDVAKLFNDRDRETGRSEHEFK